MKTRVMGRDDEDNDDDGIGDGDGDDDEDDDGVLVMMDKATMGWN